MSKGRCENNFKHNILFHGFDAFDANSILWIHPGRAVVGIQASLVANTAPQATDQRCATRLVLEYFSGAVPNGAGGWTGGSWTEFWSIGMESFMAATGSALQQYIGNRISIEFDPPMDLPPAFQSSIRTGLDHAKKGQFVAPNTHNTAESAGEWDIRAYFKLLANGATGGYGIFDGDVNVQMLTSEGD